MDYAAYATLAQLKTDLGISDTTDDTLLLRKLEAASRAIESSRYGCARHFYVKTATRTFTAGASSHLLLPVGYDLLSITTLKTDEDDDWDYDNTWATTDYHLYPFNEFPKWKIFVKSGGDYSFPRQEEGVQLVGLWGYGDGYSATPYEADTTTAEELDASETAVDVTSGTNINAGNTILVESEQMYVQSKSSNTLTVVRGVNGTTAATHATAKTLSIYRYPDQIREATLRLASRLAKLRDAPFGLVGAADMGTAMIMRSDPDIMALIEPFRLQSVG